jgi:hypothetical protein
MGARDYCSGIELGTRLEFRREKMPGGWLRVEKGHGSL